MDIGSSLDGLRSILGVSQPASTTAQPVHTTRGAETGGLDADRATLSSAGSEAAQASTDGGVRADKVAAVQSALAQGTYEVPASAVASKIIDTMLGTGK